MIWGMTLEPGKLYTETMREEVQLSMAAMDSRRDIGGDATNSFSQIVMQTDKGEYVLCTLIHGVMFQQNLDLKIMPREKVTFSVQGSSVVYLVGYTASQPGDGTGCGEDGLEAGRDSSAWEASDSEESFQHDYVKVEPMDAPEDHSQSQQGVNPPAQLREEAFARIQPLVDPSAGPMEGGDPEKQEDEITLSISDTQPANSQGVSSSQEQFIPPQGPSMQRSQAGPMRHPVVSYTVHPTNNQRNYPPQRRKQGKNRGQRPGETRSRLAPLPNNVQQVGSVGNMQRQEQQIMPGPSQQSMPRPNQQSMPGPSLQDVPGPSTSENLINEESFFLLDGGTLERMVPKVGPRMQKHLMDSAGQQKRPAGKTDVSCTEEDSQSSLSVLNSPASTSESWALTSSKDTPSTSTPVYQTPKRLRFPTSKDMFSVREVLEGDDEGGTIIGELTSGQLTQKCRRKMVRLLVSELIQVYGDRPCADVKISLAKQIIQEFPKVRDSIGEGFESFYTPGSSKHPACGFLELRLRNIRRKPKRGAKTAPPAAEVVTSEVVEPGTQPQLSEEESAPLISWLKANRQPASQVKEYMAKAAPQRLLAVKQAEKLETVLGEFPRLLDTQGMIEQDFRLMFPTKENKLFEVWENTSYRVLDWARLQGSSWRRHFGDTMRLTDEQCKLMAFLVLPYVLPTGTTTSDDGRVTKFTKNETVCAFIDVQPVGTNLPEYMLPLDSPERRKQPFILVLGEKLSPSQVFLIVERNAIPQSTVISAVDACFKAFYVLNSEYPPACKPVWEFIQHGCFQIPGSNRPLPAVLRSLVSAVVC